MRKAGNNGFSKLTDNCAWCTERPIRKGSTGLFVQIMTNKFGSKIEDVEDRLNEFLETGETIR